MPDLAATDEAFAAALLELLNDELSLDPSALIALDTDLLLTGLVDSLGVIQVVSWIEDELDTSIDPIAVTLENFQTPGAMIRFAATLG